MKSLTFCFISGLLTVTARSEVLMPQAPVSSFSSPTTKTPSTPLIGTNDGCSRPGDKYLLMCPDYASRKGELVAEKYTLIRVSCDLINETATSGEYVSGPWTCECTGQYAGGKNDAFCEDFSGGFTPNPRPNISCRRPSIDERLKGGNSFSYNTPTDKTTAKADCIQSIRDECQDFCDKVTFPSRETACCGHRVSP